MKKDSWLYSDVFLKRAFAIWGYNFVANAIIAVPFFILWFVFFAMFVGIVGRHTSILNRMDRAGSYDRGDMMDWTDDSDVQMRMQVR